MTPAEIKSLVDELRARIPETDAASDVMSRAANALESFMPREEKIPFAEIIAAYHLFLPALPKISRLTETRRRQLAKRWNEDKERQNTEWWRQLFRRAAKSDFICGRVPHASWIGNFDFLLQPKSLTKLLEGSYDNRQSARPAATSIVDLAMHSSRTRGAL